MERFAKVVNGWKLLIIFAKRSILDVWQGSEYASAGKALKYKQNIPQQETVFLRM